LYCCLLTELQQQTSSKHTLAKQMLCPSWMLNLKCCFMTTGTTSLIMMIVLCFCIALAAFCCCCWHCMSQVNYSSCSDEVMRAMAADTMRSSKHLVEDIVGVLPVLLYQVRSSSLSRPVSQHTAAQGLSDHRLLCVAGSTSGCDCLLPVGVKGARHYLHWSAAQVHAAVYPAIIPLLAEAQLL